MSDTIRGLFVETNGHVQIVALRKGDREPLSELLGIGNDLVFTPVKDITIIGTPIREESQPNAMAVVILHNTLGIGRPVRGPVIFTGPMEGSEPTDLIDTGFTIDGMDPADWVEAMEGER